jgi:hypothetical protein
MMHRIIACLVLFSPFMLFAQKKDKHAEKISKTISAADLKTHLYIIASKEMEGRDTPSPGLEKAATYIEEHFKSLGLTPGNNKSYRQYYPLYRDSMLSTHLKINGWQAELNKDFQPQTNNFSAEMRFSEVVFAGYGISDGDRHDDYKDLKVAGKLVMIMDGSPADYKPSQSGFSNPAGSFGKISAAMNRGATALLVIYGNYPRKTFTGTSNWSMNGYKSTQNPFAFSISPGIAASILKEDTARVVEKIKAGSILPGTYKADIDLGYAKTTKSTEVSNVIAVLEGTDKKDEYVFITSHYDHVGKRNDTTIYYGADDDGSGTVGVLELAQAFAEAKKAGRGPRRSIVFMTVSGEEKGLWGSAYYANHPIFLLEKTTVDLNIDMIGRIGSEYQKDKDSANYIYLIGDDKLSSDLAPIANQVNSTYSKMKLDRKYNDPNDPNRFYFRSDHYNFAEKGVPILFYFNGTHADYHRPTDTPDKINYSLLEKRAKMVFYTAWEMANREEMLRRDLKLEKPKAF